MADHNCRENEEGGGPGLLHAARPASFRALFDSREEPDGPGLGNRTSGGGGDVRSGRQPRVASATMPSDPRKGFPYGFV